MVIDPSLGVWIGLAGSVCAVLIGGWFAGVFDRPSKKPPHIAAE